MGKVGMGMVLEAVQEEEVQAGPTQVQVPPALSILNGITETE